MIYAIANGKPHSLRELRPTLSGAVEAVVDRTLLKDRSARFSSAEALAQALVPLLPTRATVVDSDSPTGIVTAAPARTRRRSLAGVAAIGLIVLVGGLSALWWMKSSSDVRRARNVTIPQIQRLVDEERHVEAMALARSVETILHNDPELGQLWDRMSTTTDLESDPTGALVSYRDVELRADRVPVGKTPSRCAAPSGHVALEIETQGIPPLEVLYRVAGLVPERVSLPAPAAAPDRMIRIAPGPSAFWLSGYDDNKTIALGQDFLDRFEVTNREFKAFVDGGGYQKPEFWNEPLILDGRTMPWAEAVARFRDQTGRPGPAAWEVGTYPADRDEYPVNGMSWAKPPPTGGVPRQELTDGVSRLRAAGIPGAAYITPLSNVRSGVLLPVGQAQAVGLAGASDMAGNLKQWCWNEVQRGMRYVLGGAWNEPDYMFLYLYGRSPWDRSANTEFRLVNDPMPASVPPVTKVTLPQRVRNYQTETPPSDEVFAVYRQQFAYDPTPLDARVEQVTDREFWRQEKISFNAKYGKERVPAYLYTPKHGTPPYPLALDWPGSGVLQQRSSEGWAISQLDFVLKSGRAVLAPVYYGTFERNAGRMTSWPEHSRSYIDWVMKQVSDGRRALDYAQTRSDLRSDRIAYFGSSWGSRMGPMMLALDHA